MVKVVLTPEAKADVTEITTWYCERSIRAAEEFLLAVGVAFARIESQPTAQVIVDADTGTRRALPISLQPFCPRNLREF